MANLSPLVKIGGINGTPLPTPSTYEATTATIVDSARNAKGVMIGSVIRSDVAKISMTWKFISAQDWADMLSLFSEANGGHFINDVYFFLQDTNRWEKRTMYVSDRTAGVFMRNDDTFTQGGIQMHGSIKGYLNAKLSLIEV